LSHTSNIAAPIVDRPYWLALTFTGYDQAAYLGRICNVQHFGGALSDLQTSDWIFGLINCPLFGAAIVNEVTSYHGDGSIGKSHCNLTHIIQHDEGRYWKLSSAILHTNCT
jgi:hypothetical protein